MTGYCFLQNMWFSFWFHHPGDNDDASYSLVHQTVMAVDERCERSVNVSCSSSRPRGTVLCVLTRKPAIKIFQEVGCLERNINLIVWMCFICVANVLHFTAKPRCPLWFMRHWSLWQRRWEKWEEAEEKPRLYFFFSVIYENMCSEKGSHECDLMKSRLQYGSSGHRGKLVIVSQESRFINPETSS